MEKKKTYKSLALPLFAAILGAFILTTLFSDFLKQMLMGFLGSLTPIIVGMLVVFILKHLIDFIERTLLKKAFETSKYKFQITRGISLVIAFTLFFIALFAILYILVPRIVEIVTELITNSSLYIDKVRVELTEFINKVIPINTHINIDDAFNGAMKYIEETFYEFLPKIFDISTNTLLYIGKVLLGFFIAFLYLIDKEKIHTFFSRLFKAYLTESGNSTVSKIFHRSDKILLDYLVGKFLEAIVITLVMGITLMLLKVPYAFELAFIMSILNFIPYIGFILALVPITLISIIFGSVNLAITVILVNVLVFTLLTTFVTPFIIGSKIKTSVLLTLVLLLIAGGMFGIIGMAVAPPVSAILNVVITENIASKEEMKKQEKLQEELERQEEIERRNKENAARLEQLFKNYGSSDAKHYNIFDLLRATNSYNDNNEEIEKTYQAIQARKATAVLHSKGGKKTELFKHAVIKQKDKD